MSFTKQLFEKTSMALPDITARTFSRYCGKSEGYYGSISAQNLDLSTHSLIYLSEVLELKGNQGANRHISEIQSMIADEIAKRIKDLSPDSLTVSRMVIRALVKSCHPEPDLYSAPPILIG